jgi:hypothetical protein
MSPPYNWKGRHSGELKNIPGEIILYITSYLDYFDGTSVLKQVNKHFLVIIRSEWPLIPQYLFEYSLKRDYYQLCMRLNKEKAIYYDDSNNHNMKLVHYLAAIMNESSLLHHKSEPISIGSYYTKI